MKSAERNVLDALKKSIHRRFPDARLTLFGSRAREDADPDADLDVLVIVDTNELAEARQYVSECAWEASFDQGMIVVPVVYTQEDWENGPERYSLLAKAVRGEGVPI